MKGVKYVYKDSKGELRIAMSGDLLVGICILFWILPIFALIQFIWHFFTDNTTLVKEEEYYKIRMNESIKKAHKKT